MTDWRPCASLPMLRARAGLLRRLRDFFAARDILEVETPVLSRAASSELHLESFVTRYRGSQTGADNCLYLHTSPEYPMKRLLAAGSGAIFQIAKVFRDGESGSRHNPEFTLLEWYRIDFDHWRLMDEVDALVRNVLPDCLVQRPTQRLSYREAFLHYAGIDVHSATVEALADCANTQGIAVSQTAAGFARNTWLDMLMTHVVEPCLGQDGLTFIYDYPADQASLARIRPGEPSLAERFELYVQGVELANGFCELTDPVEQHQRFEQDNAARCTRGLPTAPLDEHFLAALAHGLPACAGVALGVDRLLMLVSGARSIQEVLAFPVDRA